MSYIATFNEHGEILQSIICPEEDLQYYNNYIFLQPDDVIEQDQYYIPDINNPVKTLLLGRPSDYHQYDYVNNQWVILNDQLELAQKDKKDQIVYKMNQLRFSIIPYDGKNLDANEMAQLNVVGKISQLQNELALALPSNDLFWKDADNIVHTWTDPNVYLQWLQGLQVQFATRNTTLYNQMWQAKTTIDNMTDITDIINFSVDDVFI